MSRVAFITTMKAPDHPVPSGDRTFARLILAALEEGGHAVEPLTMLRTWRRAPEGLDEIEEEAATLAHGIAARWQAEGAPGAILTYHNYHKGPDLLGPALANRFGLPYAIVEPSRSPRRADGEWGAHFQLADRALTRADALGAVTKHDVPALHDFAADKVMLVPPFIDAAAFRLADRQPNHGDTVRFVCAAMLRGGRKADSVRVLANAWPAVSAACPDAALNIAGDGEARAELEPLFPPGTFKGLLSRDELARLYANSDVFVWPAIDEPFGFTFLEAQAAGLAVIGGHNRGVPDVVAEGESALLVDPHDSQAFADAMIALACNQPRRTAMAAAACRFAAARAIADGAKTMNRLLAKAAAHREANA